MVLKLNGEEHPLKSKQNGHDYMNWIRDSIIQILGDIDEPVKATFISEKTGIPLRSIQNYIKSNLERKYIKISGKVSSGYWNSNAKLYELNNRGRAFYERMNK